jgi:glutamine amidotransferase
LSWIKADVVRIDTQREYHWPLPHMGWNDVYPADASNLFRNIDDPRYYFLHSYCIVPHYSSDILATTNYGVDITAAVNCEHIFGTQFHPEKSHQWGIDLLRNFAEL